jgi:hypothetical protein
MANHCQDCEELMDAVADIKERIERQPWRRTVGFCRDGTASLEHVRVTPTDGAGTRLMR